MLRAPLPAADTEQLPFEVFAYDLPMSRLQVHYVRNEKNIISATQSSPAQEYPVAATPLGIAVVAHIVNGMEAVLEKLGNV